MYIHMRACVLSPTLSPPPLLPTPRAVSSHASFICIIYAYGSACVSTCIAGPANYWMIDQRGRTIGRCRAPRVAEILAPNEPAATLNAGRGRTEKERRETGDERVKKRNRSTR